MSHRRYPLGAIAMSTLVVLLALAFCGYASSILHNGDLPSYPLQADFVSIGALKPESRVELAGVQVGKVTSIELNKEAFTARVHFIVRNDLKIPNDSLLTIGHATPFSGDALLIEPGRAQSFMVPTGQIKHTHEPITLEQQISNYIFGLQSM